MFLKMAILAVLKRPKRTALILLTVGVSVFVMEFVSGWVEGMRERMTRQLLDETAHLVVQTRARSESLDPLEVRDYIPDAGSLEARLSADPRVERIERVTPFGALAVAGGKNLPIKVTAVEPSTGFFSQVGKGALKGAFPFDGPGVAVSKKALDLIAAPDAKSLIFLVQDAYGSPSYRELPVACVFATDDTAFDTANAFMDAASAADLVGVAAPAELWAKLADPETADAVRADYRTALEAGGTTARTWKEIKGSTLVFVKLMDAFMLFINAIVLIVAAAVITNAILMNVFEKRREYGTLRAIGMKRRGQASLVLLEGAAQGLAGAVLGALAAFPVVWLLKVRGLPVGEASRIFGGGDVMYFGFNFRNTVQDVVVGTLIAVAGSLYAAWIGTRPSVVDALRSA